MSKSDTHGDRDVPWPQQLLENIWWLAGAAIVFWVLTYIVWGLVDIWSVPPG